MYTAELLLGKKTLLKWLPAVKRIPKGAFDVCGGAGGTMQNSVGKVVVNQTEACQVLNREQQGDTCTDNVEVNREDLRADR